jgi:ssDNA-binding Zn-finger/Zn-ribbon topoisomerase 1
LIQKIHSRIEGLKDGSLKECPKCNYIKNLESFKDDTLVNGYGRYCNECKYKKLAPKLKPEQKSPAKLVHNVKCPVCNALVVVRTRRSDGNKFYGCSKFPRCRGTQQIN